MSKVAREYAKALFLSLNTADEKTEALDFLRALIKAVDSNSDFKEALKSGTLSTEALKTTFTQITKGKATQTLQNFLNLLVDKRRFEEISSVAYEFEAAMDIENNVARGVIKSASLISPEKRADLESRFSKKLDKKVILTYEQDPKVVAGLRVEVGAFTFDDTLETHIKNIKENLNRSWN